jgi:hypothetical protein
MKHHSWTTQNNSTSMGVRRLSSRGGQKFSRGGKSPFYPPPFLRKPMSISSKYSCYYHVSVVLSVVPTTKMTKARWHARVLDRTNSKNIKEGVRENLCRVGLLYRVYSLWITRILIVTFQLTLYKGNNTLRWGISSTFVL